MKHILVYSLLISLAACSENNSAKITTEATPDIIQQDSVVNKTESLSNNDPVDLLAGTAVAGNEVDSIKGSKNTTGNNKPDSSDKSNKQIRRWAWSCPSTGHNNPAYDRHGQSIYYDTYEQCRRQTQYHPTEARGHNGSGCRGPI